MFFQGSSNIADACTLAIIRIKIAMPSLTTIDQYHHSSGRD